MDSTFIIYGRSDKENIVFNILNGKSNVEIEDSLLDYTYHNMVFCLLIIAQKTHYNRIDLLEHLEENQLYLAPGNLQFIMKRHPAIEDCFDEIFEIFSMINTANGILNSKGWLLTYEKAKSVLNRLKIPVDYKIEDYEEKLDYSFLVE